MTLSIFWFSFIFLYFLGKQTDLLRKLDKTKKKKEKETDWLFQYQQYTKFKKYILFFCFEFESEEVKAI